MDNPFSPGGLATAPAAISLAEVLFCPVDSAGQETGAPIPVRLDAQGTADISGLPSHIQSRLGSLGTPDEMHLGYLKPRDGARFLAALVRNSNGYEVFRLPKKND
jgi:hypothetical protein